MALPKYFIASIRDMATITMGVVLGILQHFWSGYYMNIGVGEFQDKRVFKLFHILCGSRSKIDASENQNGCNGIIGFSIQRHPYELIHGDAAMSYPLGRRPRGKGSKGITNDTDSVVASGRGWLEKYNGRHLKARMDTVTVRHPE